MRKLITIFLCVTPVFVFGQWVKTNGLQGGGTAQICRYGDTLLTSSGSELYYSSNHAKSWNIIPSPDYYDFYILNISGDSITGYARERSSHIYRFFLTDDFFQTITPLALQDSLNGYSTFAAYGYVYATSNRYSYAHSKLFRSNNAGATWEKLADELLLENPVVEGARLLGVNNYALIQSFDGGYSWDTLLHFSGYCNYWLKDGQRLFVFTGYPNSGTYVSLNDGANWNFYPENALQTIPRYFAYNNILYAIGNKKIWRSSDLGQHWENLNIEPNFGLLGGVGSGGWLILSTYSAAGIIRSNDGGIHWSPSNFGMTTHSGQLRVIGPNLYAAGIKLYKLDQNQENWPQTDIHLSDASGEALQLTDYIKYGNNYLAIGKSSIYVSETGNGNWVKSGITSPQYFLNSIVNFLTDKSCLIALGYQADFYGYYITDNDGKVFYPITVMEGSTQVEPISLATYQGKVYVLSMDGKLYESSDACLTWSLLSDELSQFHTCTDEKSLIVCSNIFMVHSDCYPDTWYISVDKAQTWLTYLPDSTGLPWGMGEPLEMLSLGDKILLATDAGIYYTKDHGLSWLPWNEGLLNDHLRDMLVFDNQVWVSASGGGIWKRPLNQLNFEEIPTERAQTPSFPGNPLLATPNPADQFITITPGNEPGQLLLTDQAGRLLFQQNTIGESVRIKSSEWPAGLYYLLLKTPGASWRQVVQVCH